MENKPRHRTLWTKYSSTESLSRRRRDGELTNEGGSPTRVLLFLRYGLAVGSRRPPAEFIQNHERVAGGRRLRRRSRQKNQQCEGNPQRKCSGSIEGSRRKIRSHQHGRRLREFREEGASAGHDVVPGAHPDEDPVDGGELEALRRNVSAQLEEMERVWIFLCGMHQGQ